jgi:hypothetical protein
MELATRLERARQEVRLSFYVRLPGGLMAPASIFFHLAGKHGVQPWPARSEKEVKSFAQDNRSDKNRSGHSQVRRSLVGPPHACEHQEHPRQAGKDRIQICAKEKKASRDKQ